MARVTRIDFTKDGPAPTVELSTKEAALIMKMIGRTTGNDRDTVLKGGGEVGSEIYDELCAAWCFPYWEEGDPAKTWNGADWHGN